MRDSALDLVKDKLWLGTKRQGEGGERDGQGIVIQTLDGKKKIGLVPPAKLTSSVIYVVRYDNRHNEIWLATDLGLDTIDLNLKVKKAFYFYYDFSATASPKFA